MDNKTKVFKTFEESAYKILFRKKYGFIKRARGSFLYTAKNIRLLDLAQDEGRALMGWRHGSSMLALKNTVEKGLWASYPSGAEYRLKKALTSLFAICGFSNFTEISWYQSELAFFSTDMESSLKEKNQANFVYPWSGLSPLKEEDAKRNTIQNKNSFIFVPPFPWPSLYIFASKEKKMLTSQNLSTALIEALTRSIYDLIKEFPKRSQDSWAKFDTILESYFTREGSLLIPKMQGKDYDEFALHCLESEIFIAERNPESETAPLSFVPWFAERTAFKKL